MQNRWCQELQKDLHLDIVASASPENLNPFSPRNHHTSSEKTYRSWFWGQEDGWSWEAGWFRAAGVCKFSAGGGCEIMLSKPVLKSCTTAELKKTLLHEMIHAYLFTTSGNKDHEWGLCSYCLCYNFPSLIFWCCHIFLCLLSSLLHASCSVFVSFGDVWQWPWSRFPASHEVHQPVLSGWWPGLAYFMSGHISSVQECLISLTSLSSNKPFGLGAETREWL